MNRKWEKEDKRVWWEYRHIIKMANDHQGQWMALMYFRIDCFFLVLVYLLLRGFYLLFLIKEKPSQPMYLGIRCHGRPSLLRVNTSIWGLWMWIVLRFHGKRLLYRAKGSHFLYSPSAVKIVSMRLFTLYLFLFYVVKSIKYRFPYTYFQRLSISRHPSATHLIHQKFRVTSETEGYLTIPTIC